MQKLEIKGGKKLSGTIEVSGAKNATLPILASTILTNKKVIIKTIRQWQSYSYSKENLNCQYYPSCSNYFALSVFNNNTYVGVVKGIDRIVRCNHSAKEYFDNKTFLPTYTDNGRMIDKLNPDYNPASPKSSLLAR